MHTLCRISLVDTYSLTNCPTDGLLGIVYYSIPKYVVISNRRVICRYKIGKWNDKTFKSTLLICSERPKQVTLSLKLQIYRKSAQT